MCFKNFQTKKKKQCTTIEYSESKKGIAILGATHVKPVIDRLIGNVTMIDYFKKIERNTVILNDINVMFDYKNNYEFNLMESDDRLQMMDQLLNEIQSNNNNNESKIYD